MRPGRGTIVCAVLALAGAAAAEPLVFDVDATASEVSFELDATLHTVEGRATLLPGGRIYFDPDTGRASGVVRIDARSLDTENERRDRTLHGDVLESERYPKILFTPGSLEVTGRSADAADFVLEGELEIHGGRHAVALVGRATGTAPGRVEATAEVTLPYVEWGLKDVSNFLLRVGKEVRVRLAMRGDVSAGAAPAR